MNTFTIGQFAKRLRKSVRTLQQWDRDGILKAHRTPTGRRYYTEKDFNDFFKIEEQQKNKKKIAYCRVSSQNQKPDLKNQRTCIESFCLACGKPDVEYIEEIGGGLNFKRKKFLQLVEMVENKEVEELILAHKDRLVRFGFDFFELFFQKHGVKLTVINNQTLSPEQEMVQDLMTIIHCFSSRLYGLRNYKKSLKEAIKNEQNT